MSLNILRLLLLLLTPLSLSFGAETLGLRVSLSGWLHKEKTVEPAPAPVAVAVPPPAAAPVAVSPPVSAPASPAPVPIDPPVVAAPPSPPERVEAVVPAAAVAAAPTPASMPAAKPKPAAASAPLLVSRVRTANNDTSIRIVIDLNGPPRFTQPVHKADRLEIDLSGTEWTTATAGPLPATPLTYRVETPGNALSRLIIAGRDPIEVKAIFALPPEQGRGHRLVIDVVSVKKPDGVAKKRT